MKAYSVQPVRVCMKETLVRRSTGALKLFKATEAVDALSIVPEKKQDHALNLDLCVLIV